VRLAIIHLVVAITRGVVVAPREVNPRLPPSLLSHLGIFFLKRNSIAYLVEAA